jgi:hypothetical protein
MSKATEKTAADILEGFLARGNEVRRRIAEDLCAASGARLVCTQCKREETLTVESTLRYISEGWPKCCGREMEIHTGLKAK